MECQAVGLACRAQAVPLAKGDSPCGVVPLVRERPNAGASPLSERRADGGSAEHIPPTSVPRRGDVISQQSRRGARYGRTQSATKAR